jgi:uncharacterized protein with FMN-binding domain
MGGEALKPVIKRVFIILILIAVIIPFANRGLRFYRYQQQMETLELGEIHPETLPDGTYSGSYDVVLITVEVEVEVSDGIIREIQLIHEHDRGARAEVVVQRVIENQSLNVDTVSGATDSSRVILKAVEQALTQ